LDGCNIEFQPVHGNQKYCSEMCKYIANRENKNRYDREQYKRNPKRKMLSVIGTSDLKEHPHYDYNVTYLGAHLKGTEFILEIEEVHRAKLKLLSGTYSKSITKDIHSTVNFEENNNGFNGMQNTHHQATIYDYFNFSITYLIENCPNCPECGYNVRIKDLHRCEVVCTNPDCGILIQGAPHPSFKYPEVDVRMAETAEDIRIAQGTGQTVQEVAFKRFKKTGWINQYY
jgi:hypothetical protein